jgi:UDPglucose 6-dehydrogenase
MIVCVQGLWHLGSVTAACLAAAGHSVIGLDFDPVTVAKLTAGTAPIAEPGLDALLQQNAERLEFTRDATAAAKADVLWVAYDTPVDAEDRADVEFVIAQVTRVLPHLRPGTVVIVSSQLPAGSTARLAREHSNVHFACSPENLRLGKAIAVFREPDRVVVGVRDQVARARIAELLAPITTRVEWMSIESAEMTKHAINAFLALSVTFANELAAVCERVGARTSRLAPRSRAAPSPATSHSWPRSVVITRWPCPCSARCDQATSGTRHGRSGGSTNGSASSLV